MLTPTPPPRPQRQRNDPAPTRAPTPTPKHNTPHPCPVPRRRRQGHPEVLWIIVPRREQPCVRYSRLHRDVLALPVGRAVGEGRVFGFGSGAEGGLGDAVGGREEVGVPGCGDAGPVGEGFGAAVEDGGVG